MIHRTVISVLWLCLALSFGGEARSAEVNSSYLIGTWVLHGDECSGGSTEKLTFRENGAVEAVRAGRLEAAGFWALKDDRIQLDVISPPAFFHEFHTDLSAMAGEYYSFRIRIVPFNVGTDGFEAVGVLGEQLEQTSFARCRS